MDNNSAIAEHVIKLTGMECEVKILADTELNDLLFKEAAHI